MRLRSILYGLTAALIMCAINIAPAAMIVYRHIDPGRMPG